MKPSKSDIDAGVEHLSRSDPVLADVMARIGPCSLSRTPSYFGALLESIVWQQLSYSAASTIHNRVLATVGTRRPTPAHFANIRLQRLRKAGLSQRKAEYVKGVAEFFESGRFPRRKITSMSDEEVVATLTEMRGIGRWSAEMFLMFALNRLDVFSIGDLGLRKAVALHYRREHPMPHDDIVAITEKWRPYRTIACWYLWRSVDNAPTATA